MGNTKDAKSADVPLAETLLAQPLSELRDGRFPPRPPPLATSLHISVTLHLNKLINILKSKKVYDRSYTSSKILLVRGSGNSWYNSHNFYVRLQILQNAK